MQKLETELKNCYGIKHFKQDLYSLAGYDYIVGPRSTYSGLASFGGEVPLYFIENPNETINLNLFRDCWEYYNVEFLSNN
jgi:hypothetical protein